MITATWCVERLETSDDEYQSLKHAGLNTFGDVVALSGAELAAKAKISRASADRILRQIEKITREEEEDEGEAEDTQPEQSERPAPVPAPRKAKEETVSDTTLNKLIDMQEYIEGIQGFAMVLKENLRNSGGMDEKHTRAAAYVAEEIYENLSGVLEFASEIENELTRGGRQTI